MSLATDQTLNPGSPLNLGGVAADKVYNFIGYPTATSSLRRVASTALTAPDSLVISHRVIKEGAFTVDQHMVRLDEVFTDALLGAGKGSAWLVTKAPRGTTAWTTQLAKNQVGRVFAAWLASGNADKILNGEM